MLQLEHHRSQILAKSDRHRMAHAVIYRIIGRIEGRSLVKCLIEGKLQVFQVEHLAGQESGRVMVNNARPDINVVEVDFLGVASREDGMQPEEAIPSKGIVNTLCLNDINSRIVVASLEHPVAFAVAVHLDGDGK